MNLVSIIVVPGKSQGKTAKDVIATDPAYAETLARRGLLALLFVITGLAKVGISAAGFAHPDLRHVENDEGTPA
jgi:hypothetical protein